MELSAPGHIRVATMNLWGRGRDWSARRSVLVDGFRHLAPDLVAFQEAVVGREGDQVVEVLGGDYQLAHHSHRQPDGQGISVASRWPIERVDEVDLHLTERTAGFECGALATRVRTPLGPLLFVNHFPNWQLDLAYERELQAVATASFIEDTAPDRGDPVVVAGDLDADPEAASIRFWTGRQSLREMSVCYRDAWEAVNPGRPGHSFGVPENPLGVDWDWPFRRIDYVLVRCADHGGPGLVVRSCDLIFDRPVGGVWASDHFGVTADLVAPPAD